jgi:hypothetical protein
LPNSKRPKAPSTKKKSTRKGKKVVEEEKGENGEPLTVLQKI